MDSNNNENIEEFTRQVDENIGILVLTKATEPNGNTIYIYLNIIPSKYGEYAAAHMAGKAIDFSKFGTILATGNSYPPPENIQREMEEKHGFNHNFEKEFMAEMVKQLDGVKGKFSLQAKRSRNYPFSRPQNKMDSEENN